MFYKLSITLLAAIFLCSACGEKPTGDITFLDGSWQFRLDSADAGISEKWYLEEFSDHVVLPGSMKDNEKGLDPDLEAPWTGSIYDSSWYFNPKLKEYRSGDTLNFPFWLTPNKLYLGPAWYRKNIQIPESWKGRRLRIHFERPHWETHIWFDTLLIAHQNSLSAPHEAFLDVAEAGEHSITIRVDNRLDEVNVGPDSHSVTDHTQGNWNGIIGAMYMEVLPGINIDKVQLFPDLEEGAVHVQLVISNPFLKEEILYLKMDASSIKPARKHTIRPHKKAIVLSGRSMDTLHFSLEMGKNFNTWDEFHPDLYKFTVEMSAEGQYSILEENFGMREIRTRGKEILVNGNPVFLRGNVDCAVFPLTGYPPMDKASWKVIFSSLKDYGLNHLRFHSWCPPEAAFDAADEMGIYLQPEGPSWPNHGTSLGDGREIDQYIYEESERIISAYGNHPSFAMFASGNEPRGNYVAFLDEFLRYWKEKDDRRIYTGASIGGSWTACPENQFHVKGGARGLPWKKPPNSTFTYERNIARFSQPFVTHELGQYCVFPDFSEIPEYTGNYRAYNFEMFKDLLEKNHMGDQAEAFLNASGELQKRCYKYEMEASLRTRGMVGYQLLGLNDFPGQGTALVGVLNAFYKSKGYADPAYFKQFTAPLALLATLPKFVWEQGELFTAGIELANYSADAINARDIQWKITGANQKVYAEGSFSTGEHERGLVEEKGVVEFNTTSFQKPEKLTLTAQLDDIKNSWDFWVYPELGEDDIAHSGVHVTSILDEEAVTTLRNRGKVLLLAAGSVENGKDVVQYFTPVFWNTSWFKMRPPHTTGVLIKDDHPVFNEFPTDFHSDLQWWEILNRQQVMNLEYFPPDFRPIVQPIDTWFINRRLGLLWEAEVEGGKLLVCSADLQSDPASRPAARQLLYSILKYMDTGDFNPTDKLALETVQELFLEKEREIIHLYTKDSPDELKPTK